MKNVIITEIADATTPDCSVIQSVVRNDGKFPVECCTVLKSVNDKPYIHKSDKQIIMPKQSVVFYNKKPSTLDVVGFKVRDNPHKQANVKLETEFKLIQVLVK